MERSSVTLKGVVPSGPPEMTTCVSDAPAGLATNAIANATSETLNHRVRPPLEWGLFTLSTTSSNRIPEDNRRSGTRSSIRVSTYGCPPTRVKNDFALLFGVAYGWHVCYFHCIARDKTDLRRYARIAIAKGHSP